MQSDWLSLLVTDTSVQAIHHHREELIRGGTAPEEADRQAGVALQLHAMLDERRRRAAELTALNDIAAQLTSTRAVDELLRQITMHARRLLGTDLAYIGVVRGAEFVFEVTSGALTPQLEGLRIPRTAGMLNLVLERGEPTWTSDYASDRSFAHDQFDALASAEQFRALLGVPLSVSGRVIGALFVCKRAERHFHDEEVALLVALASHAAIAIDNAAVIQQHRDTAEELRVANTLLERTLAWDRQLTEVVLRGGGVEDLVSETAAAATGRVLLLDAGADLPDDIARRSPALVETLAELRSDSRAAERVSSLDEGSIQVAGIVADRRLLGVLVLLDGDDHSSDQLLLERAAPAFALTMIGERAVADATRLTREAMVIDLLSRPAPDPAAMRQRMRAAGLDPAAQYCVAAIQPTDPLRPAWRGTATADMPAGTIVAADGTRLLAVVPTERPEALAQQLSVHSSESVITGIAGPTHGPNDLHRFYQEAVDTVNALLRLGRRGAVSTADQLGIYRVLLNHTGVEELKAQFDQALGAVVAEQNRRDVPMLATLRTYLDHGGRAAPAARALGIHVNTLYQRITVLDRLLGPQWREPPRSLDLHILLRIFPDPR